MDDQGPRTPVDFEQTLLQLVGRRVEAVSYFEILYKDAQSLDAKSPPMWNRESESFDSLDFGLQLELDDGSTFSVTWGTEFTQYNVSIRWASLDFEDGVSARRWNASERWRERGLLDTEVIAVRSSWWPKPVPPGKGEYPQHLKLEFASGAVVVISAFESRNGKLNIGMMDHITVFFDEMEALRMT